MNTPSHLVLNLLVVGRGRGEPWRPITLGALLPDLPMLIMYVTERLFLGTPEMLIWQERYYAHGWQLLTDGMNSLPLIAALAIAARLSGSRFVFLVALSMGLHCTCDLLVHHDDAHRHLLPFSDWRFQSPISYWDPAHHGRAFAAFELAFLIAGSGWLIARAREPAVKRLAWTTLACTALFAAFAVVVWGPLGV